MTRRTIQTPAGPVVAVPMTYLIHCWPSARGVVGYALRLPEPWADLRLCARRHNGLWSIDHYTTGMCATMGTGASTLRGLVHNLVNWLPAARPWVLALLCAADSAEANRLMRESVVIKR